MDDRKNQLKKLTFIVSDTIGIYKEWHIKGDSYILSVTCKEYQPSSAGGTRSPPATPHRLQHLTARLIQNGRQGLEIG